MALFVPTTGGSNGWGAGFDALANAFAQAPLNRMKAREAELNAQNIAADNARAQKMLELQYAQEKRQADAELVRLQLLRDADARNAAAAGEALTHAQLHNPQIREGQSLQNTGYGQTNAHNANMYPLVERKAETDADISDQSLATAIAKDPYDIEQARLGNVNTNADIASKRQSYRQNEGLYPDRLRKGTAEADTATTLAAATTDKYNSIPAVRDALTQDVMGIVERGLPEFDVGRSLKGYVPPPKITLPGLNPTMDYPEASPAMDDVQRRQDIMKRVWELTLPPAAAESVPKDWAADTAANVLAGQRDTVPAPGSGPFGGDTAPERQLAVADAYAKKIANRLPTTEDEDRAYSIVYHQLWGDKLESKADPDGNMRTVLVKGIAPLGMPQPRFKAPPLTDENPPAASVPAQGQLSTSMYPTSRDAATLQQQAPVQTQTQVPVQTQTAGQTQVPVQTQTDARTLTDPPVSGWTKKAPTPVYQTVAQATASQRATAMTDPLLAMIKIAGFDPATGKVNTPDNIPRQIGIDLAANSYTNEFGNYWAGYPDKDTQMWQQALFKSVDPIIRMVTGAALNVTEGPQYRASWYPRRGDDPEVTAEKFKNLITMQAMFEKLSYANPAFRAAAAADDAPTMNRLYQEYLNDNPNDPDVQAALAARAQIEAGQTPPNTSDTQPMSEEDALTEEFGGFGNGNP